MMFMAQTCSRLHSTLQTTHMEGLRVGQLLATYIKAAGVFVLG